MTDVGFGGTTYSAGYTDVIVYSDGIGLPTGRVMANGSNACLITALLGYCSGRGATRGIYLQLGSSATGTFNVGAAGSAASTGWVGSGAWLVAGGSARFNNVPNPQGSRYFARGGGGTTTDGTGYSWSGTMGGAYRYVEAPSVPLSLVLSSTGVPGEIQVDYAAPASNGGSAVTGYEIEYADNPSFTGSTKVTEASLSKLLTGLTPGLTYYVRVSAINAVTTAAGTTSVRTAAASIFLSAGGKVWNGSSWVPGTTKVWDGTSWVISTVKVWDGSNWVPAL